MKERGNRSILTGQQLLLFMVLIEAPFIINYSALQNMFILEDYNVYVN